MNPFRPSKQRPKRESRRVLPVLGVFVVAGTVAAVAALAVGAAAGSPERPHAQAQPAASSKPTQKQLDRYRGSRGKKGERGTRGSHGDEGPGGAAGPTGPSGTSAPGITKQNVTINWQNGQDSGRNSAGFTVPGLGHGRIDCRHTTSQDGSYMLAFTRDDHSRNSSMWIWSEKTWVPSAGGGEQSVNAVRAGRLTQYTDDTTNEGLNTQNIPEPAGVEPESRGNFTGIIQPDEGSGDGAPPPTTFRLSWHWNFGDGNPRCFVAATFLTRR